VSHLSVSVIAICHSLIHLFCIPYACTNNSGIGRGIALSLARDGAKVVINYNSDAKAANLVVESIKSIGGAAIAVQVLRIRSVLFSPSTLTLIDMS
jgi:hypothetical protein